MTSNQDKRAIIENFVNNGDLESLESKISRFNIFESIGMVRQEIKHSNFLKFLLDPSEKHKLGDLLLKELLTRALLDSELEGTSLERFKAYNFSDAEVRREWRNIDLLIYSPSNRFVCTIENKVDSSEGINQLMIYEKVIEKEFPNYNQVFIYLTKEGTTASDPKWLPLSYGTVANVLYTISNDERTNLSEEIFLSISHYIDLVRRHIMSESEIATLCRKIYKEHRQAIDLIYEHRIDLRLELAEFIGQIIQNHTKEKIEKYYSGQNWIRFVPKEWDNLAFQKTSANLTGRLLVFEFVNEPERLQLQLTIGHGDEQVKKEIYETLKKLKIKGLKSINCKPKKWNHPYVVPILNSSDYEEYNLEDLQEKISLFFDESLSGDIKVIREAIINSFEKKLTF